MAYVDDSALTDIDNDGVDGQWFIFYFVEPVHQPERVQCFVESMLNDGNNL